MTDETPSAPTALPELPDAIITRLAAVWNVSPAEARAQYEIAREVVEAEAARAESMRREETEFLKWWSAIPSPAIPSPIDLTDAARDAWMKRANIALEYEARVEDDITQRTANTSADMDRVTQQRDRALAEVDRLEKLVNDLHATLRDSRVKVQRLREDLSNADARIAELEAMMKNPKLIIVDGSISVDGDAILDLASSTSAEATSAFGIDVQRDRVAITGVITAEDRRKARDACTEAVLREVAAERARQFEKWGEQRHPLVTDTQPRIGAGVLGPYYIPTSSGAKRLCEDAFAAGNGTFGHILVEEVAEAIDAPSIVEMRAELIQVAAVAVQMVEAIDRHG